jgi:hypothetical protein
VIQEHSGSGHFRASAFTSQCRWFRVIRPAGAESRCYLSGSKHLRWCPGGQVPCHGHGPQF